MIEIQAFLIWSTLYFLLYKYTLFKCHKVRKIDHVYFIVKLSKSHMQQAPSFLRFRQLLESLTSSPLNFGILGSEVLFHGTLHFIFELMDPYVYSILGASMDPSIVHPININVVVVVQACLHLESTSHTSFESTFPYNIIVGKTFVFYKKLYRSQ